MRRILWLDVIRVIAIYFVVVIHNSVSHKPPSIEDVALSTILATCNPLFVMVSGALLLGKKESYSIFFTKRVKKVLLPWIIWTIVYMFWHYEVDHYKVASVSQLKYFFELTFLSQLWFLPMIFGLYLLTPVLRLFIQKSKPQDIYYVSSLWFIFLSALPFLHDSVAFPINTNNGLVGQVIQFSGYFILGYLLSTMKLKRAMIWVSLLVLILNVVWVECANFHLFHLKNLTGYGTFSGLLSPNTVMISLTLFILIKELVGPVEKKINPRISAAIVVLSKASLGIYLVHQLIMWSIEDTFKVSLLIPNSLNSVLVSLGMGLFFFLVSFFCVYILQKLPVIKNAVP